MRYLQVTNVLETGLNVTAEHFGGNIVFPRNTDNGIPSDGFSEAQAELDIGILRYPAGAPDETYVEGMVINDGLPEHLVNFLEWARKNDTKVVIVTPTFDSYPGTEELTSFARLLLTEYGELVHAFEIGNEYWGEQGETAYGKIANDSVIALEEAIDRLGLTKDIWVQMGNAAGRATEFPSESGIGWVDRTIATNDTIIDQLSAEAREIIDGVVEHYYFRDGGQFIGDIEDVTHLIGLDFSIWSNALGDDISLNITEWNIRTSNIYNLGLRAASSMLAQFQFMIELKVDEAYVWPPQHNTTSDLAGSTRVIYDDVTGIVVNTVSGATFDLMSTSLVGAELIRATTTDTGTELLNYVYETEDQLIVYVASRSESVEHISYSLGDYWSGAVLESAVLVGYDRESSNGIHFDRSAETDDKWSEPDFVLIDGQKYYLNEHDANAQITVLDVGDQNSGLAFEFELLPFEIIQITYDIQSSVSQPVDDLTIGTNADDHIVSIGQSQTVIAHAGDDTVRTGRGEDTVRGGKGDDHIVVSGGSDQVIAGAGDDFAAGWGGNDSLLGGKGHDTLNGWHGDDLIIGGRGQDRIDGGKGEDQIHAGRGRDVVQAGSGHDTVDSGDGRDAVSGGLGDDHISAQAGGDTISGGNGADTLLGQGGQDFVKGGNGNDSLLGGKGDDKLIGGMGNDRNYGGKGEDTICGSSGSDYAVGGHGADKISGNIGDDSLFGGAGGDTLFGGKGKDYIVGGNGRDYLFGGVGDDTLTGGMGSDNFVFRTGAGTDRITDFNPNSSGDTIDLSSISSITNFREIFEFAVQVYSDVEISLGDGGFILISDFLVSELEQDHFVF